MPEFFRLRSDLLIRPQEEGGRTVYVIKDPLTGRFFQLREPEHFLITRMDGATSVPDAEATFAERFGSCLAPGAAEAFFRKMQRLCLFEGVYAEAAMADRGRQKRLGRSIWSRMLMWRIKAFNPDAAIGRIERRTRWMFTPEFVISALVVIGLSLATAAANRGTFFIGLREIFQVGSIIGILAAIFVLAAVHEFAHAVALKRYGGAVNEMGFLILYFQPCVYCNLSDAYLLSNRRQKTTVMLAGLFFQLFVTALMIFIWRITEVGTVINRFSFLVAAVSLAIALFNLNPLIKLDGYYVLTDWVGLSNLRGRAFRYLKRRFLELAIGRTYARHYDDRYARTFVWYGLVAFLYSAFLIAFVGYHLTVFLARQTGWAGPLILWGVVSVLLARPLWKGKTDTAKADPSGGAGGGGQAGPHQSSGHTPPAVDSGVEPESSGRRRSKRPLIFWGIIALVVLSTFFIHGQRKVGSECRVTPASVFTITNPEPGVIDAELFETGSQEIRRRTTLQLASADFSAIDMTPRFSEGQRARAGDTLLVISSNRYKSQLASTEARLTKARAELNLLYSGPKEEEVRQLRAELAQEEAALENEETEFARAGRMHERNLISDEEFDLRRTRLSIAQERKAAKQSELALLVSDPKLEEIAVKEAEIEELNALVDYYRSQIEASVFIAPFTGRVSWVRNADKVFEMIRTDTVRVVIPTSETDIGDVDIDAPVRLKVRAYPFDTFEGRVAKLAIATRDSGEARDFEVITAVANPSGLLRPGMTGHAKIYCGDRRLSSLILRRVIYFFRVEFWSWW